MSSSLAIAVPSLLPLAFLQPVPQTCVALPADSAGAENSTGAGALASFADMVGDLVQQDSPNLNAADTAPARAPRKTEVGTADTLVAELDLNQPPTSIRLPLPVKLSAGDFVPSKNWPAARPVIERKLRDENEAAVVVPTPPQPALIALSVQRPAPPDFSGDHQQNGSQPLVDIKADTGELLPLTPDNTVFQIRLRNSSPETAASRIDPAETRSAVVRPEPPTEAPVRGPNTLEGIRPPTNPGGAAPERRPSNQDDARDAESDSRKQEVRSGTKGIAVHAARAVEAPGTETRSLAVPSPAAAAPPPASSLPPAEPPRAPGPVLASASTAQPASAHEPDVPPAQPPQQVRSMALEFTPDGGRDVRLRVVERGGEVHVSVHSTDTGLTGRLQDGVQDLAGALVSAGYDADAWTPRDDQQRRQPQPPPELARTKSQSVAAGEEFAGLFDNPLQETR